MTSAEEVIEIINPFKILGWDNLTPDEINVTTIRSV